jgi:enterobacterial common antigen flippase
MWGALLMAAVDIFTRSLITRKLGIEAAGIYQSAWALSGLFAYSVLAAMGADFYPRLTKTIHDHEKTARAVNEQTEIGILLALPGLLAVLAFASLAIKLLYTEQFLAAADLMPWLALGVFGRVVSWPLSYVQIASGASRWFAVNVTALYVTQALLTLWLVEANGTIGAAYAFVASYALFLIALLWVNRVLIGFSWSAEARNLIMISTAFIVAGFAARYTLSDFGSTIAGGVLTLAAMLFCLRGLAARLGRGHRIVKWLLIAPGGRYLLARETENFPKGEL